MATMPALWAWKRISVEAFGGENQLGRGPFLTHPHFCGLRPQPKILSPKETKKAERQEEDIETARKPSLFPLFSPCFGSFGYTQGFGSLLPFPFFRLLSFLSAIVVFGCGRRPRVVLATEAPARPPAATKRSPRARSHRREKTRIHTD